ncbi:hypothetical protein N665_2222s0003 [Sinapis alba]|nr:hypothetical protein N665_2222s0003 [Sinapis alba]
MASRIGGKRLENLPRRFQSRENASVVTVVGKTFDQSRQCSFEVNDYQTSLFYTSGGKEKQVIFIALH